jgi:hypothetical protein
LGYQVTYSSRLVLVHWYFMKLWFLDLEKYQESSVFCTSFFFLSAYKYSYDIWYTALLYQVIDQSGAFILHEVMVFGLLMVRKLSRVISFLHFFSLCLQIFFWYLVHCLAIPSHRSSSSLVLVHWFVKKYWPLDLVNIMNC